MSEDPDPDDDVSRDEFDEPFSAGVPPDSTQVALGALGEEIERLESELYDMRGELSRFEQAVEDRTVKKPLIEDELRRYVRARMRRQHARGWGPYLVLLYGTIMTLGAFYYLAGGWSILAMIVIWLSTLGLYVVMIGVGVVFNLLGIPGRLRDVIARRRS